jgi:NADH dehydrogenase FAD-containing subunit
VIELPTGQTVTGQLAWLAWLGVHLTLLNGAEQKISTFVDWGWTIFTQEDSKRTILSDEGVAPVPSQS